MLCLSMQSVLALYAAGKSTGVVLEVGDTCCYSQAIYEGVFLDNTVQRGHLAGADMSQHLMHLVGIDRNYKGGKDGLTLTQAALLEAAYSMKDKYSIVGAMEGMGSTSDDVDFSLPDGKTITISGENREACVEPLFNPQVILNSPEAQGVQQLVAASINKAELDLRRELGANVILSGGSTCIQGFEERFKDELASIMTSMKTEVTAPEERATGTWTGGSILAELESFQDSCMSSLDYAEEGATYVHEKFSFTGHKTD